MNHHPISLAVKVCTILSCTIFITAPARAQSSAACESHQQARAGSRIVFRRILMHGTSSVMPAAGPPNHVVGSGTLGRLPKWTAFTNGSAVVSDSTIFEDKFGKVG